MDTVIHFQHIRDGNTPFWIAVSKEAKEMLRAFRNGKITMREWCNFFQQANGYW